MGNQSCLQVTLSGTWLPATLFHVFLSFEWNSIRLGGPAHGIVTKTVHKTLPGGGGGRGWGV